MPEPSALVQALQQRTGYAVGPREAAPSFALPPSVSLADGLDEGEAAELALRNNPQFRAELAGLDVAGAAVVEARLLPNPELAMMFPLGSKQLEQTWNWSIDALLQRPWRVGAAERDYARAQEDLVQRGLQTVFAARLAHSEALLARERARLAYDAALAHSELAEIAQARLRVGDISELEASAAQIAAMRARDDAAQLDLAAAQALGQLRLALGMEDAAAPQSFELARPATAARRPAPELAELLGEAAQARPDVRASEYRVEAAGERVGLEGTRALSLGAIVDGNENGADGESELGPGGRFGIPLFHWNQGARARARAELAQARHQYAAVRQSAANEVREARESYERARAAELLWQSEIGPAAQAALERARLAHEGGQESYRVVLEVTRQLLETRARGAEVAAQARRAAAQLDLRVGRRVFADE